MNREEAITALGDRNNLLWGMSTEEKKYYSEALDMAISALSAEGEYIKRNDVIKMLNTIDRYVADKIRFCDTNEEYPSNEVFVVDDVYEELDELPTYSLSAKPDSGEYIKKEDALDKIVEQLPQRAYMKCQKAIDSLPTYPFPDREKGEWQLGGYDDMYYVCSKCDFKASEYYAKPRFKYCPNCGADMRGEANG